MLSIKPHPASFFVLLALVGCTPSPQVTETTKPRIVATSSVLCDLTEQIAQDTVDLTCLVPAGVDPHVYQPTPEDRKAIDTAQLILYGGYNFDANLVKLIQATGNPAEKVAVHEKAVPNPLKASADSHDHHHHHDHSEDTAKSGENTPDPHVWHDPNNGIAMITVITDALNTLQPDKTQQYQAQASTIKTELSQIDQWIKGQIATIPPDKRKLVTTHDALGYYVNAYGLEFQGALSGLSTEESPTAARVSELVKDIKKSQVPTIFAETSVNPKLLETVAKESQVNISERELYADGIGEKGTDGDSYQKMLISNTQTIVEGLGGNYQNPSGLSNK